MSSLDVIVPCHGYGRYLRTCVRSVLGQPISNVRVLIIDDASPDNTGEIALELAEQDPRVTFVRHIRNKGHIETYNEGIGWVTAKYYLLLSADDYLLPNELTHSIALLEAHPEVGFTFGCALERWEDGGTRTAGIPVRLRDRDYIILSGSKFIALSGSGNIVNTPTAVVRTDLQNRVGGYRTELPHSGDMEMWLRLAANAPVGIINICQAVYRRHANNMSLGYQAGYGLADLEQRRDALESFLAGCAPPTPNRLRTTMLRNLSYAAIRRASSAFNRGDMESMTKLLSFALEVCPNAYMSLPKLKLSCKQLLGSQTCAILRSFMRPNRSRANDCGNGPTDVLYRNAES